MVNTPKKELYRYYDQLEKMKCIRADIGFLKKCLLKNVLPKFIQINYSIMNDRTDILKRNAMRAWLISEIWFLYAKVTNMNLELYILHKEISCNLYNLYSFNSFKT